MPVSETVGRVSEADRLAARELCELWIPTSREGEVAEIIAKHVGDEQLREQLRLETAARQLAEKTSAEWFEDNKRLTAELQKARKNSRAQSPAQRR